MNLPALTIVRFFAALGVVLFHYGHEIVPVGLKGIVSAGYNGVVLFFILSGFILTVVARHGDNQKSFWIRRFARIYPVYALAWLAFGVHVWLTNDAGLVYAIKVTAVFGGAALLLVQLWLPGVASVWNWPGWSLSAEAFFYAVFPWLGPAIGRLRTLWPAIATLLFTNVLVALQLWPETPLFEGTPFATTLKAWIGSLPIFLVAQFALGVTLGHLFLRRGPLAQSGWFVISVLIIALMAIEEPRLRDAALVVGFAMLIYSLASVRIQDTWITRVFVLLGNASYSLYILQSPCWKLYWFFKGVEPDYKSTADVLAFCGLLIGLSVAVYVYFERPMERRIKAMFTRRTEMVPLPGSQQPAGL